MHAKTHIVIKEGMVIIRQTSLATLITIFNVDDNWPV